MHAPSIALCSPAGLLSLVAINMLSLVDCLRHQSKISGTKQEVNISISFSKPFKKQASEFMS